VRFDVVSKRDYTLMAIHCMYSRRKKVRFRSSQGFFQVPAEEGGRRTGLWGGRGLICTQRQARRAADVCKVKPGGADRLLCSRRSGEK
jgi:hypothetical protein